MNLLNFDEVIEVGSSYQNVKKGWKSHIATFQTLVINKFITAICIFDQLCVVSKLLEVFRVLSGDV